MNMIEKKMTTKEVAESLSCTVKTVLENAKKCLPNKVFENGKPTEWSEAEVTVLLDYMKEHSNRPDLPLQPVVKATETSLTPDLVIFKAEQEITALHEKVVAAYKVKLEQLEKEKNAAIEEVDRIYQVEHNFHNKSYSASQIAAELGVTPKKIGALANQHRLKIDPIYGKLCKIQLQNGKWVDQFMYNEEAKEVLANLIAEEV